MSVVLSPLTNFYLYEGLVRGGWNLSLLWLHPLAVVAGAGFVFDRRFLGSLSCLCIALRLSSMGRVRLEAI